MQGQTESSSHAGALPDGIELERERWPPLAAVATDSRIEATDRGFHAERFNDTAAPSPLDQLIHKLFEIQVDSRPDAIAAIWGHQEITYAELNRRANQVAHALLRHNVRIGDRVGLYVERSLESLIGMLGTLKAGAAYVPLDASYPPERLEYMSRDSEVAAVLTTIPVSRPLWSLDKPIILLEGDPTRSTKNPEVPNLTSRNLAYVIYTSGSTGRPKGVMVEHRNVLGLVINTSYAPIGPDDTVAHCASTSFDATTWEVWTPLLNGGRVLIVPQAIVLDPIALNKTLVENNATTMFLTVGLFNEYVDALEEAFGNLKYLLTGGEALVPSIVAHVLSKSRSPEHLLNAYGPTETTTIATTYEIKEVPETAASIPIGKPITHSHVYILNEEGEPVPIGATGEIYIGGAGVARGYLNQRTLTNERFVADQFGNSSGTLYRTGDLGRLRVDGNIEFLGRNDQQVKIRGFRVELGEVEAALQSFPGVRQAVAVAREDAPGAKRLLAYVVPKPPLPEPAPQDAVSSSDEQAPSSLIMQLREYLKNTLPPYMVPAIIVPLNVLPLTPNGKVDRLALPAPEDRLQISEGYVAPNTPMEETLSAIWKEALKVERVGIHDNFFELGGDSLMGIETISRASDSLSVDLHFMALFQYPTIHQLALHIDELRAEDATRPESGVFTV